ncbi:MAG: carbohydrate ABC transporter permease [Anaerolineae bacterium]
MAVEFHRGATLAAGTRVPMQSVRWRRKALHTALQVFLILFGFTFLVPLIWVLITSLKRGAEVFIVPVQWIPTRAQWDNYIRIFQILPFGVFIRNTLVITIVGTMGSVVSALSVGFSLGRLRWPGRGVVFTMLLASLMLPDIVLLVPTFVIFKSFGWLNSFYPLIVPSWFGGAFYIFLMRQFMMGIPYEMDEAARIDGAGSVRILFQLIAPMSAPAIATVAIFSFLAHYNDFMGPLIYLSSNEKFTVSLGLYWLSGRWGNQWNLVMAASTITLLPVVALFFAAQRHFVQGIQFSGLTGR